MDEEELILRITAGDMDAFNLLYDKYSPKAYRTALLITGSPHTAEDTVQEAFIICLKSLNRLKSPKAFGSYLYRTLVRLSWRLSARDRHSSDLPPEDILLNAAAEEREDYSELYAAVAALDPRLRTVVVLFYFNDMPIKEIARATGTPTGTVKSRLNRAKKRLAAVLRKEDFYG